MIKSLRLAAFAVAALVCAAIAVPALATDLPLDGNFRLSCGTATGLANASTLANKCGVITTESVTTAAGATYLETIANTQVAATGLCFASVATAGTGTPAIAKVTPGANSVAILVQNIHASVAFNNTLQISFICFK